MEIDPHEARDPRVAAENRRRRLEGCMLDAEVERRVLKETLGGMTEILPVSDTSGYGWIIARGD
jgi:hypothetical protein